MRSPTSSPSPRRFIIIPLLKKTYPLSTVVKFAHILILDILNIVFSILNHYTNGVIIHSMITVLHLFVFCSDFIFTKCRAKRLRKYSQQMFDWVYMVSAYVCLMALILYSVNYFRNPASQYANSFPHECLGQSFKDSDPIQSVCRRLSPLNPYHTNLTSQPSGFRTQSQLQNEITPWLRHHRTQYGRGFRILSSTTDFKLDPQWTNLGFSCNGYYLIQMQTRMGFIQDLYLLIISRADIQYLQFQSELRLGLKDYGLNDENLNSLLQYFQNEKQYSPLYGYPISAIV